VYAVLEVEKKRQRDGFSKKEEKRKASFDTLQIYNIT
jgi:hypothetical protein